MAPYMLTPRRWSLKPHHSQGLLRAAATKAREAYEEGDAGKAAVKFRELLGENGDGDLVFPMPPGYNEDGTKRAAATLITPGESKVPAGDRRFG